MKSRPRVLLLMNQISSYRKEVYELIAQSVDLTVGYTDEDGLKGGGRFTRILLPTWKIISMRIQKPGFKQYCNGFDVVIFVGDLHNLSFCSLAWRPRKFKIISWSIGMRASYTRPYNITRKHDIKDWIYGCLLRKVDACIFYMEAPLRFWGERIDQRKVFIAHNTVPVLNIPINYSNRKDVLFVGSLYKEKGLNRVLNVYKKMVSKGKQPPILNVVGDGAERESLQAWAKSLGLDELVFFHGPIYDELRLSQIYASALLCISPNQAGLSVLKAMGYGVAFAAAVDAITGGELLNVVNGRNGVLFDSDAELECLLEMAGSNPDILNEMGRRARADYLRTATVQKMSEGVFAAIMYVMGNKNKCDDK